MIKLLNDFDGSGLRVSHYSDLIRSHLSTYGTGYDFCRFYEIAYRRRVGVISVFNGAVTADFCGGASILPAARREISEFLDFMSPESAELPPEFIGGRYCAGYIRAPRTFFSIPPADTSDGLTDPDPKTAFDTAYGGAGDYGLWLTDTVRRKNLGSSFIKGYESSVLTVRFMLSGRAYITDVATPESDRGKGYARELLGRASRLLLDAGYSAYLAAGPDSVGYYRSLGYPELGADTLLLAKERRL